MSGVESRPLTKSQLMIWTGQQLQPDDPLYNMALSFRIRDAIDPDAFRAAFRKLIENSDALRTTFAEEGGVPMQRVHERLACEVEIVDLRATGDPDAALSAWQRERARRSFDLRECLFDSVLVRLADDDYAWFLNQHHLITDAWSTALVYHRMSEYYALVRNGGLDGADPPPAFADYVEHEAKQRDSKAMIKAKAYWRRQLAAPLAPSGFYRPTPRERSGSTIRMACDVGAGRSARVRELAGSDPFRTLWGDLARFQVFATALFAWLHRVTGNPVLTIGTPNHNRGPASHKKTIGLFIEVYPLRLAVDDGETFATLYAKVARGIKELLINAPPGACDFEHNRAYDVLLNYITASFGDFAGMRMNSEWVHADHGDRNHLLRVQVEDFDNEDRFRVFFDLNADTFVGDERDRPANQFLQMLDAFLDDPERPIAEVGLLSRDERAGLAQGSTCTEAPRPVPDETVYEMFRRQAERTPDRIAISCGDRQLSYAELLAAAESLAAMLTERGVGAESRVAISLGRSIDAVTAILGVMASGAAYVPVDPTYPRERIAFMVADAGVSRVLSESDFPAAPRDPAGTAPGPRIADTAYVIYTSGSTGQPKGVDVGHRGLANYIAWARDYYLGGEALDWPLFSSLSFDLTVTSIFVPLVSGGRIVVYPEAKDRREITVRRVVEDDAVDIVKLTPAHLTLLQAMDLSGLRLKKLIVGGEDFTTALARSVSSYFGDDIGIYNEYGPTEGTVACMVHRFDPERDAGPSVPIGRAIDNAFVYVLDRSLRLQPRGVVGELCIGGAGVANGYLHRDDQTRERFVENPFRPGERMYRTGDLARVNADGTLTCLGRCDGQMKISGIRIEPGEVEAALLAHPRVSACAVRLVEKTAADGPSEERFCVRCGLSDRHPAAMLDDAGVCRICHVYEAERERARAYFGTPGELARIVEEAKASARGDQDCMMLLSGGKDSTYALCQLVDLGLTPLVFTLDNGFISEGAKANMRRIVGQLGLELVVGSTPAMNEIFVDSLQRFSNVCNGCFKTIYSLSMKVAHERGIRHIFTGLSRGQIFETRVADLFRQRIFDPARIDATIVEARKAYHRADDAVSRLLDLGHLDDDSIFEEIRFVDYYRYTDVSLDEILEYLRERVPWVRPEDTGRSTNCLINEVGIHVHKQERGFHNYGLPYSWDVRLGHKERDAAMHELDDDINVDNVQRILAEIGYRPRDAALNEPRRRYLAAYYVSDADIDERELRDSLSRELPAEFVPARFVRLDALPLTPNGKVDRDALPEPELSRSRLSGPYVAPEGRDEAILGSIWAQVFGLDNIGVNDNFFDLGGDSIMNIQIVSLAMKQGLMLSPQQVFDHPTIAELARVVDAAAQVASEQGPVTGEVPLTPAQIRFFESGASDLHRSAQYVLLEGPVDVDLPLLEEALRELLRHHDGLRSRFEKDAAGWRRTLMAPGEVDVAVERHDLPDASQEAIDRCRDAMLDRLDLASGRLVRASVCDREAGQPLLLIVIHHLVVDAVSWWVLVDDLDRAYRNLTAEQPVSLPPKTMSARSWSGALDRYASSGRARQSIDTWRSQPDGAGIPVDEGLSGNNDLASAATWSITLDRESTRLLTADIAATWRVQAQDVLVTSLVKTLSEWSGAECLTLDLEGHGREPISDDVDLLRTVGWFTAVYPVTCTHAPGESPGDALRRVRQTLHLVPDGGIGYGALRYLGDDESGSALAGTPQVLFNYLGKWRETVSDEAVFRFAAPVMASSPLRGTRSYLLEINASVFGGELRVDWTYSKNVHRESTIAARAERFKSDLLDLIAMCASAPDERLSPADFPSADLSQSELDEIVAEFGQG